jgi:hypothetical protein
MSNQTTMQTTSSQQPSLFSSGAREWRRTKTQKPLDWWGPIWRGLPVEPGGKHYRAMHTSVWLYLYLVIHADRATGTLYRLVPRISQDMGIHPRTIRRWLARLKRGGYVVVRLTGRSLHISIQKWKPLRTATSQRNSTRRSREVEVDGTRVLSPLSND